MQLFQTETRFLLQSDDGQWYWVELIEENGHAIINRGPTPYGVPPASALPYASLLADDGNVYHWQLKTVGAGQLEDDIQPSSGDHETHIALTLNGEPFNIVLQASGGMAWPVIEDDVSSSSGEYINGDRFDGNTLFDIPVFKWSLNWLESITGDWTFDQRHQAIGFGPEFADARQEEVFHGWGFNAHFRDDEIAEVNTFLDSIEGRSHPFWLPGPLARFRIIEAIDLQTFIVSDQSATEDWQLLPNRYLWFYRADRSSMVGKIESVERVANGEKVTLTDPLDQLPELYGVAPLWLVRMVDDVEAVEIGAERFVRRTFKTIELPLDYDTIEESAPEPEAPVFLYHFSIELDETVEWFLTSHPEDITDEDEQHWVSARIQHDRITRSARSGGSVSLSGDIETIEPLRLLCPQKLPAQMSVEIFQTNRDGDNPTSIFVGQCGKPEEQGRKVTVSCTEWGDAMDARIPGFFIQPNCNYRVYESATCKASTSGKSFSVTAVSASGRSLVVQSDSLIGVAQNWFAFGWIDFGSGVTRRTLFISASSAPSGNQVTLSVSSAPSVELPATGTLFAGCDGLRTTCVSKFDNLVNFGGHDTPKDNLSFDGIKVGDNTGGKK